jgi:DNA-binding HxlR family transcriptional regulator
MIDEALGGSRDTLSKTLSSLTSNGLVAHAPGTRGLYSLTTAGLSVGAECGAAVDAVRDAGTLAVALKKWPMMVLTVIGRGCTHYSEIKIALPGITSRALAGALKDLEASGLATRTVGQGYPPSTGYALTSLGDQLFPAMDQLARACERAPGIRT